MKAPTRRVTNRLRAAKSDPMTRRDGMIRLLARRSSDTNRLLNRRSLGRSAEPIRRRRAIARRSEATTVRRREASSDPRRLLPRQKNLLRHRPHAKALLRVRRKGRQTAQRRAGQIINSGIRDTAGVIAPQRKRPANFGWPLWLRGIDLRFGHSEQFIVQASETKVGTVDFHGCGGSTRIIRENRWHP